MKLFHKVALTKVVYSLLCPLLNTLQNLMFVERIPQNIFGSLTQGLETLGLFTPFKQIYFIFLNILSQNA